MEVWVQFFKDGFFGYGEKGDFAYYSLAHWIPLILLAVSVFLVYRFRGRLRAWKHEETFRFLFAFAMLLAEMSYFWRLLYVGSSDPAETNLLDKLPLQVCEWTCIMAIFMITKKSKLLYQICFYVCLTIGIFPLLTPSVITTTGPTYYRYYQYWMEHILPIVAVFYMTFVHAFRPRLRGVVPAAGFMAILVVLALICNFNIEGANYLYLATGTADGGGSVMDVLIKIAPSVWGRLALLTVIVMAMFLLAYGVAATVRKLSEKGTAENAAGKTI
ncbi:MAG: TIGR02206 family membrane protein [Clostridia bacterium]|nr:TIGR02206 family membrane protein [Clostridia bacterium]